MQYSIIQGAQGLCPNGWHIPTDGELSVLTNYLGGLTISGGKMKEVGTVHWATPNTGATNSSGFTALPGGLRANPDFQGLTTTGAFWSSTQLDATGAYEWDLSNHLESVYRHGSFKWAGSSLRCLQGSGSTFSIGQNYGGGIIFYIDGTGQHGLISASNDQGTGVLWGCFGTSIPGTSIAIGAGQINTTFIVSGCSTAGIAARICDDLVLNGYDDWFLPSRDELNEMYLQRSVIGGFAPVYYWSSSEYSVNLAWLLDFSYGSPGSSISKNNGSRVRAVRAF